MDFEIGKEDRAALLALARDSIAGAFGGKMPRLPEGRVLAGMENGAFVTLTTGGMLRGCIGRIETHGPLSGTIRSMALAAAFEDPRFPPLEEKELAGLHIEITILGPRRKIVSVEEIVVGRHGVTIQKGSRSAVFLPQVATEQGWSREELLEQLCHKAGLQGGAWRERESVIMVFEGLVFGE
jgi:AmmeMemoRadiSam system protein A